VSTLAAPALPRPREVLGEFGIYVHVPFCSHRCGYCDFNAYAGLDEAIPSYMEALALDARTAASSPVPIDERPVVTSIFVGGGTPSLVPAASLAAVLHAIRETWPVAPDCEITCEANPESATPELLRAWREAGVNRVSFGVQSLDDRLLGALGRVHDAATAVSALLSAMEVFDRVSADLILGIPGEDDETWEAGVRALVGLGLRHLSCYGLTYEEGTPLHSWKRLGKVVPVPDDDVARRWETADEVLSRAGLGRYEISNWAVPGEHSRHNDLYWRCGEYLGIGAGAHSHLDGVRSWTVKGPDRYARGVREGTSVAGSETIDAAGRATEVMFCGLRRSDGVSADAFRSLTGVDLEASFRPELDRCAAAGLLEWDGSRARLTRRGTLLANEVLTAFLG